MKQNVDLTQARTFSSPTPRFLVDGKLPYLRVIARDGFQTRFKTPEYLALDYETGDVCECSMDIDQEYRSPFLCGNAKERKLQRYRQNADEGKYCDRCGAAIFVLPWASEFGLCKRCRAILDADFAMSWKGRKGHG